MKKTISLNRNKDFKRLYYRGKSAADAALVLYCQKSRDNRIKLGITVSKKLGNAVKRNRIKRRIREAYRLSEEFVKPGYHLVIVARNKSARIPFALLQKSLLDLMKKTGCYLDD